MAGRKGKKNLTYFNGKIINSEGVRFTVEEKKQLESLVNSAMRKRNRMIKNEEGLQLFIGGKPTGKTIGETYGKLRTQGKDLMGFESDFILAKKSKSLNKFGSHKEFEKYVENLKRVVDRGYVEYKVELYKENHIKAIEKELLTPQTADQVKKIVDKIKGMSTKEYMKMAQQEADILSISYTYLFRSKVTKLNKIYAALGIGSQKGKKGKR
jgi:hypothetical protein